MRRFAAWMSLAIALLPWGCTDLSPPLQPATTGSPVPATPSPSPSPTPTPTASPSPTPTPVTTGAVRGFVVGRNGRLGGAKVAIGAVSTLTSYGGQTVADDVGNPVKLGLGEFLLLKVASGSQTLSASYDGASNSLPVPITPGVADVTATPSPILRLSDDLFLPADGPVATGSTAIGVAAIVLPGSSDNMIDVQKASGSLNFLVSNVDVRLKAPPNSRGDAIGFYSYTYLGAGDATLSTPVTMQPVLPSVVTVPPAPGPGQSGPTQDLVLGIKYTGTDLAAAWTFAAPNVTLRIELFNTAGVRAVDRNGNPIVLRVPCLLVP